MTADPVAQWGFTVVFAALAAYSIFRIVVELRQPLLIVGHSLHVLMAVAMAVMAWPMWTALPVTPQLVLFGGATIWFLLLCLFQARTTIPQRAVGEHGPWHQAGHAVVMSAMVWMVAAMRPPGDGGSPETGHAHALLAAGTVLTGIASMAALLVTGAILLVESIECLRRRPRTWSRHFGDVAPGAVMSFAMAAMCWLMLAI